MEQQVKPKKKMHGCFIAVMITALAFAALVIVLAVVFHSPGSTEKPAQQSELAKVMELTDEQEKAVKAVFDSCGIGEITSVEVFQKGDDRTSYHLNDSESEVYKGAQMDIVVWLDNKTKAVQEIYFNDATIYAEGTVQGIIKDYYIPGELRTTYMTASEMLVNNCLTYPDTAKYPSSSYEWRFGVHDGLDVVQAAVKAQNAFGVPSTMQFSIKFNRATGSPVSLVIDGKEYIK